MKKIFMFIFLVIILSACSEKPKPEDRFAEYVDLWNEQQFTSMHEKLASNSKTMYPEKAFSERYQTIYNAIEATNVKINFIKPKEEVDVKDKEEITFPYSVSMDTIAGKIDFTHEAVVVKEETEEGEDWFIKWNSSHLFPQLKEGQEIKVSSTEPVRGQIFDRNGLGLAENGQVNEVGIEPGKLGEQRQGTIEQVAGLLEISTEEIEKKLNESWVKPDLFVPIKRIDPNKQDLIQQLSSFTGVTFNTKIDSRYYPLGEKAAHLIGYIQTINADELKELEGKGYTKISKIGRVGLEQVFEERLRGEIGWKILIPKGEVIAEKAPVNGIDITLTIDANLQQNVFEQLLGDSGTAVAMHPRTGETLALVSSPSYNPNGFIFGISTAGWNKLNEDPLKPLMARFNKTFSPGSTLKPLTAAIGLQAGVTNPDEKMLIEGLTWTKGESWGGKSITRVSSTLTKVNLHDALLTSDNIYFARTALAIGKEKLEVGLQSFGFDEAIPFEFPTRKSTITNDGFTSEGLLADSGYGQGEIQMSPIHMASAYSAFVNEGSMMKPQLEKKEGSIPTYWKKSVVSPEHTNLLLKSLIQIVENPLGTAHKPVVKGISIAGKTGTAELKASKEVVAQENGWFIAMNTPDSDLLIAVMIENVKDRGGSHYVVPKVKQLFSVE
ncbi:penicillin-binding transpeptidase domain-containing protein [Bacillus sp. DJP31]|uniref:penicillin-binding transpeptidase domain-containing protein n=1 Tax=Bacillus sp. DJP31 TaxID=3409789 RepID=UPI003BB544C1